MKASRISTSLIPFQMILRLSSNSLKMFAPLFMLLVGFSSVDSLAVMSVDLGSEWMKVAVVSVTISSVTFYHNLQRFDLLNILVGLTEPNKV